MAIRIPSPNVFIRKYFTPKSIKNKNRNKTDQTKTRQVKSFEGGISEFKICVHDYPAVSNTRVQ